MMMHALITGGMEGNYTEWRDKHGHSKARLHNKDYHPNPNGFFEGCKKGYSYGTAVNMVSKVMMSRLQPGHFKFFEDKEVWAICMKRDETEREMSLKEWNYYDNGVPARMTNWDDWYNRMIVHLPLIHTWVIDYADVIADPLEVFIGLSNDGWPIDAEKAASVVDSSLYRHRRST